jgi:hypothetical protein
MVALKSNEEDPLMTGLFSLLDKNRVDRSLKEQIAIEVKSIINRVESNVKSSLMNGMLQPPSSINVKSNHLSQVFNDYVL